MPLLPPETTLYPSDLLARPADPGAEARWWVIHTRPRAEKNLARKLLAHRLGFFLPTRHQTWRSNGRLFGSHLPLFPGYVFLHARPEDRGYVLSTRMVANFLPVPDQDELTEDLQRVHRILSGLRPAGGGTFKGQVFDPKRNIRAPATVRLLGPDALEVRGCAVAGMLLCKEQVWTRVS